MNKRISKNEETKSVLKIGKPRRTVEDVLLGGHDGLTEKQTSQLLRGKRIVRGGKKWIKFTWKEGEKLKGAERVKAFFSTFLTHTQGEWTGKKFELFDWQIELIDKLFGTFKPDGYRQFKQCYCEIAKKNGKSEFAAGVCLYLLVADNEGGPEVILAASDRNQASIIYEVAAQMIKQNKTLSKSLKVSMGGRIRYIPGHGVLKVVSADAYSKHGLNLSGCVIDELHAQPKRDLFDVLTKGSGAARRQPLFLFLTTAGWDRTSICWEVHDYAEKVRNNPQLDPTFLPIVYSMSKGADWKDKSNWDKPNPSLGKVFGMDNLEEEFNKALIIPADEFTFRRLRLNEWTESETKWLSLEAWKNIKKPVDHINLRGKECFGGLDMSSKSDLTCFSLIFPLGDEFHILPYFWIPGENLVKRVQKDKVPYDMWLNKELIFSTAGDFIDPRAIFLKIVELKQFFNIKSIAYDEFGGIAISQDLEREGFTTIKFNQNYTSYSPVMDQFALLVAKGKLVHGGHPVLQWNASNVVVKRDKRKPTQMMPDRDKSREKIDGICATLMGLDRAMREKKEGVPGIIILSEHDEEEKVQEQLTENTIKKEEALMKHEKKCQRCDEPTNLEFCPNCHVKILDPCPSCGRYSLGPNCGYCGAKWIDVKRE